MRFVRREHKSISILRSDILLSLLVFMLNFHLI